MSPTDFKKIARLLKNLYSDMEPRAIAEGMDVSSTAYDELKAQARLNLLKKMGFSLLEYQTAKDQAAPPTRAEMMTTMNEIRDHIAVIKNLKIPSQEEIAAVATDIVKKNLKPAQVTHNTTNEIVRETTVEKPTYIKETVVQKEVYNDAPLQEQLNAISKKMDEFKIPAPIDETALVGRLASQLTQPLSESINTLNMPNFRKLAMGLQGQIDDLRRSGGGGGSVTGPASSTNSNLVRWNGTTGKIIEDSSIFLDDDGNLSHNNHQYEISLNGGILNENGNNSLNWGSRVAQDSTNAASIDWGNRVLFAEDGGTQIIAWSGSQVRFPQFPTNGLTKTSGGNGTIAIATDGTDYYSPASLTLAPVATSGAYSDLTGVPTIPAILNQIVATGKNSDITDTALSTIGAGLYRISYYILDTTADLTAGAVTLNIKYTDSGASRTVSASPVVLTATTAFSQGTVTMQLASGSLTYGVSHSGIFGSATYALYLTLERII